jgi:hypothetical protein
MAILFFFLKKKTMFAEINSGKTWNSREYIETSLNVLGNSGQQISGKW